MEKYEHNWTTKGRIMKCRAFFKNRYYVACLKNAANVLTVQIYKTNF